MNEPSSAVLPVIFSTPRRAIDIPASWRQRLKDRGESHGLIGATNHHAVAAVNSDATAGAYIDIVMPLARRPLHDGYRL